MANVTQSLFGFSPQDIQAQRDAEMQKQAMQFAKLSPMESARMGLFQGINQLGNAIGGALGYEDPEIAQARARQGLLGGLDMNDPESLLKAAQSIQGSDPQAAVFLRDKGTELQTARDVAAAKQQQLASLARVVQEKTGLGPEESLALAADPATVRELMKVETQVVEANGRQVLINKNTGAFIKDLGAASDKRSVTNVNVNANLKAAGSVTGLLKDINDLTRPEQEMLKTAQTSKTLINQAASSNNSQAWEAARTQVAKAVGEGKLSNEDIRRTGVDPRLVQGALDWVNKKIEGVPNQDIMRQLYTVSTILEKTTVDRINKTMKAARTVGVKEGGLSEETAGTLFPDVGSNAGAVEWSQLK